MLEIKPIQNKQEQEIACDRCHIVYHEDFFCYGAYENEDLIGICQFYIKGDTGYIDRIRNSDQIQDEEALFLMGRATLNFINLCGINRAVMINRDHPSLAKKIGFRENNGMLTMDLTHFFTGHHDEGQE